jgi:predicted nucleotidyltransferase
LVSQDARAKTEPDYKRSCAENMDTSTDLPSDAVAQKAILSAFLPPLLKAIIGDFKDVETVILAGSFGKGRGRFYQKNGKFIPLSDFDLMVVTKRPHIPPVIVPYKSPSIERVTKDLGIHAEISVWWKLLLRLAPHRIHWYEVKFGGKVVYGNKNVIKLIPVKKDKNIPLSEGVRLLFNRTAELLELFEPEMLDSKFEGDRNLITRRCMKAILACCESLLILYGKWSLDPAHRYDTLVKEFAKNIDLLSTSPDILSNVQMATEFLFDAQAHTLSDLQVPLNFRELWTNTHSLLKKTLIHYVERSQGTQIVDDTDLADILLEGKGPYLPDCVFFCYNYFRRHKTFYSQFLLLFRRDIVRLMLAVVYLLLISVDQDGCVDPFYVNKAQSILNLICPLNIRESRRNDNSAWVSNWRIIRNKTLEILQCIRH